MEEVKTKILVCEDELLFAEELVERLTKLGHEVVGIASNSEDSIRMASERKPDLALMDIRLEGKVSGTEIAEILKEKLHIPSIFLTAYADEITLERARRSHPLGYLVKPVNDRELRMAIEFGLSQHKIQQDLREQLKHTHALVSNLGYTLEAKPIIFDENLAVDMAQKMEEMSGLVGGIAHHINNSLTVMYGHLGWLVGCGTLNDFERRQVKNALDACDRQREIVRRLLWASQTAPRTLKIASIRDVVHETVEQIRKKLRPGISINVEGGKLDAHALIDREAISNALIDLVKSAESSIIGDGPIVITLNREHHDLPERFNLRASPGWYSVISVHDKGTTKPRGDQSELFEPFYSPQVGEGVSGWGLSVAYGVAQSHGGWLNVFSSEGQGTTVSMYFPEISTSHTGEEEQHQHHLSH